jgi:hypothetical protein
MALKLLLILGLISCLVIWGVHVISGKWTPSSEKDRSKEES